MDLSEPQIRRYARQIILPEVGGQGQLRLLAASVLVIGAGGLGSPLLMYLAAAGIGRLGIVDDDKVDHSNLQRQIMFADTDRGRPKIEAAVDRLRAINPEVVVEAHRVRLDVFNAKNSVAAYDIVADGSDNLPTRLAVHDACLALRRPLVSASVQGFDGQLTTYKSYLGPPHPCLRCIWSDSPAADGAAPSCAQAGVLGPVAGVMGSLQAAEVVKELLGRARDTLSGTLVLYDGLAVTLDRIAVGRAPNCAGGCRQQVEAGRRSPSKSPCQ